MVTTILRSESLWAVFIKTKAFWWRICWCSGRRKQTIVSGLVPATHTGLLTLHSCKARRLAQSWAPRWDALPGTVLGAQQPSGRRGPALSPVPGLRWCAECEQILRKPCNSCARDPDPRATRSTTPTHRWRVAAPRAACSASLCLSVYIFKLKIMTVPTSQIITRIKRVHGP